MAVLQRRASDVRITEVDASTIITDNSSGSTALVVVSSQGPIGPTRYSNASDFLAAFGNPNAKVSFDHYCALDYFKEGNDLWAARAVGTGALYSAAVVKMLSDSNTSVVGITGGLDDPENPTWGDYVGAGEEALFVVYAKKGPGSYGDSISIKITTTNLNAPTSLDGVSTNTGGSLSDGSHQYVVSALSIDGESVASSSDTVVIAGSSDQALVTLTWDEVPGAIGYAIYKHDGVSAYDLLEKVGAASASYVDEGTVSVDNTVHPHLTSATQGDPSRRFVLDVYDANFSTTTPVESFECSLDDEVDDTGAQMEITNRINPFSRYVSARLNATVVGEPVLRSITTPVALKDGASGSAPTTADINAAWDKFKNKELYVIDTLINAGRTSVSVQRKMEEIARTRGDCAAFLDTPATKQQYQASIDFRNIELNINSSYAALFGPDLQETDPITGKVLYVPPSGSMAGLYSRTARIGAPWFSFAGLNRGVLNVLNIREQYDDGQATALYKAQVNYMRKFIGRDIALWEQQTLYNKQSAFQFLNVRQLFNTIKRSMYEYLLYALQDPNDEILQRQLKIGLSQYLDAVQTARGIKRYSVIINSSNNTPAYVNSGVLRIAVVVVPILAVHEVQLSVIASKEGVEFSESEVAAMS